MESTPYKNYIGVKPVLATPQTKDGVEGYHVMGNGAEWWQDKESFEQQNRPSEALTFGLAVEAMKKGRKVARVGWNGKGMHLELIKGKEMQINNHGFSPINEHDHNWKERVPEFSSWIGMKTADNKFVPWLASQTDILAEDWEIIQDDHSTNDVQG